ncbi:MAG: QueT transporter family protein [Nitrososphaeria archaeon]
MEKKSALLVKRNVFTLSILFATLYASTTVLLAPISFLAVFQIRISDALIPLSFNKKIGKAAIYGTALGAVISNFLMSIYGLPDVVIGALANFLASYSAYILSGSKDFCSKLLASISSCLIVILFVGLLLFYLVLGIPLETSLVGITLGSFISMVLVGTSLLVALERFYG